MSFVFTPNATFTWPVEIHFPGNGTHTSVTIDGLFAIADDGEFLAASDDVSSTGAGIDFEIDQLMMVFKGWPEGAVLNPDQTPVEPTPENIRKFLGQRPARLGVMAAYNRAVTPTAGFRAKN